MRSPLPEVFRVLQFMQRLWSVAHELQRVSKRMEAELRLTGPQRLALLMIGRMPGSPPDI